MSFESFPLDPRVHAGILAAGYTEPTPIQQQAIPPILAGHDLLGIAQTGTGKTAAFILPILQRLLANPGRGVRALILAPTRELAEQIHQATRVYGKRTGVRSVAIYGGVGKPKQVEALQDRQHERRRLAGASLGDAQQVAAGQDRWDSLLLDGGGLLIARRQDPGVDARIERKQFKTH